MFLDLKTTSANSSKATTNGTKKNSHTQLSPAIRVNEFRGVVLHRNFTIIVHIISTTVEPTGCWNV